MKNNRKIEVGQVRMLSYEEDGSCWENSMYVITSLEGSSAYIKYITGECKDDVCRWSDSCLQEDIIVM